MRIGNYKIAWKHLVEEGRTLCSIYENEELLQAGIAVLSQNDQYCKSVGRKVSLTRAMEAAKLSKAERTVIWTALRKKGVGIKK